ncbi:MAG: hypothetical protein HFI75_05775 [Lachnospiraceae bacterium]|nr:hypothetical protein [Lachnospiraceae bacterium]
MIYQNGYKTAVSYECLNASLFNFMKFCGKSINCSDLYFSVDVNGISACENMFLYQSDIHQEGEFLKQNHIDYLYGCCWNDVEKFLEENVVGSNMLAIFVMSRCLNYSGWFQHSGNSGHFVNVIGMRKGSFYISDGYVLSNEEKFFEGWIESEQLLKAWRGKNNQYIIYRNKFENIYEKILIEKASIRLVTILKSYSKGGLVNEDYFGFEVIKKIFYNIALILEDKEKCINIIYAVVHHLRWGGFLTIKYFLIDKLKALKINRNYISEYENIMETWNSICMALIKVGIKPDKQAFQKVIGVMEALCESEKSLLCNIYSKCL